MLRTRAMISALTDGRPTRGLPESLAQCPRKRRRCQRSTVSGVTMMRACLHPAHIWDKQTQKSRSLRCSFGRLSVFLYTASCWRKARFSRARWRWLPHRTGRSRSRWSRRVIIELGLSPDQSRRINHLLAGRSFGEGQAGLAAILAQFSPRYLGRAGVDPPPAVLYHDAVEIAGSRDARHAVADVAKNLPREALTARGEKREDVGQEPESHGSIPKCAFPQLTAFIDDLERRRKAERPSTEVDGPEVS